MRTNEELHTDVINLLAPITRDRYDYAGKTSGKTSVNPAGIDLHVADVRTVAHGPDGTAHPYMGLFTAARIDQHRRASGGASQGLFTFRLIVAAGSPPGTRWATDLIDTILNRARLHPSTSIITPYFDPSQPSPDKDASPTRWYTHLQYSTTAH